MLALLPPSSRVTRLTCRGRARHHPRADLGGSGEHDLAHVGVGDEALPDHRPLARQHLEQVGGQARLDGEFAEPDRGQRRPLGRFDQHRVSGGQRGRETPCRDRHREVPRRDDTDDAQRLVERDVQAARHRNLLARQAFRAGRVELQDVADVAGLPLGVADRVPGVGDLQRRQFVDVGIDDRREGAQRRGPLGGRQPRPMPAAPPWRAPPRRRRRPRRSARRCAAVPRSRD